MFRMALALGMTVAELGQRMSSAELSEWALYFELEPLGGDDEWRAGQITSMIANVNRDTEKRKQPFRAEDFMRPAFISAEQREEEEGLSLAEKVNFAMRALGGGEVKHGDTEQAGSQTGA